MSLEAGVFLTQNEPGGDLRPRSPLGGICQTRVFTLDWAAPAPTDTGLAAFDKSAPSILIPWLAAPSTRRKTGPGVINRGALSNTPRQSMNRATGATSFPSLA